MSETLKPCPFCEANAQIAIGPDDDVIALCDGCGARTDVYLDGHAAMLGWNRRAPDPITERLAEALRASGALIEEQADEIFRLRIKAGDIDDPDWSAASGDAVHPLAASAGEPRSFQPPPARSVCEVRPAILNPARAALRAYEESRK